jgi:hypothetical protein
MDRGGLIMDEFAFIVEDHAAWHIGGGTKLKELEEYAQSRIPELLGILKQEYPNYSRDALIHEMILTCEADGLLHRFLVQTRARLRIISTDEVIELSFNDGLESVKSNSSGPGMKIGLLTINKT